MGGFKLDTSGEVGIMPAGRWNERFMRWSDLSPFAQGYIEAALTSYGDVLEMRPRGAGESPMLRSMIIAHRPARFSDLAPATLAAMLEDCERVRQIFAGMELTAEDGRRLWGHRADGFPGPLETDRKLRSTLPPIHLYLADDGKVHQREGGR